MFMFLKEFNSTDIQREPAKVFAAANREPVIITRQQHEGVVMMSKKEYAKLVDIRPPEPKAARPAQKQTLPAAFKLDEASGFEAFWNNYPKKKAKADALKAWKKNDCYKMADQLIADIINRSKNDPSWSETQYVPNGATYLNGKRWTDEITTLDSRTSIEKQNDSTFQELFGKDESAIEGECDVRE